MDSVEFKFENNDAFCKIFIQICGFLYYMYNVL